MAEHLTQASYLAAAILFILSLRWLNHPSTARRGVAAGESDVRARCGGRREQAQCLVQGSSLGSVDCRAKHYIWGVGGCHATTASVAGG